ncbi:unnamed protein product [Medioppia subpectinata]|uniref:Kielin/chordin-like protein n=1 Tax=Medioppia subpectinata TaxID=1979941 RepID=A0A7R9KG18_9ACAR|nr:unnamed protein product [Medioppia subpectinata]CAG2101524.1 unnamed protein product [Medioppia subpectinata]
MFSYYFTTISIVLSILLATSEAQRKTYRGARDYELELPASRSAIDRKNMNGTDSTDDKGSGGGAVVQPSLQNRLRPLYTDPSGCHYCPNENHLIHYSARNCKPVGSADGTCAGQSCPKYFDCPKREANQTAPNGCEYKGRIYAFDAKVPVDNPCHRDCYCAENRLADTNRSEPTIRCSEMDCFNQLRSPQTYCYNVHEEGQCCPRLHCPTGDQLAARVNCQYAGREYRYGERIYPNDDYCTECTCDERWDELKSPAMNGTGSCRRIRCHVESNPRFRAGCLPIYHERTCCPIDYFCPPPEEHHCLFDGRRYRIGERLDIGRNDRTDCTCLIPPDFTCVERSRVKLPPSVPTFRPPVRTTTTASVVNTGDTVSKQKSNAETNSSGNSAGAISFPTDDPKPESVKCPPFIPEGLQCAGTNCTTIIDDNGCQACRCQRPCPVYKCQGSCYLFAVTPGQCPKCKCN